MMKNLNQKNYKKNDEKIKIKETKMNLKMETKRKNKMQMIFKKRNKK